MAGLFSHFGVRKKGLPDVNSPCHTARATACDRAMPAIVAPIRSRKPHFTRARYSQNPATTLKIKTLKVGTRNTEGGNSTHLNMSKIDQAIAASAKTICAASANHGRQPEMK